MNVVYRTVSYRAFVDCVVYRAVSLHLVSLGILSISAVLSVTVSLEMRDSMNERGGRTAGETTLSCLQQSVPHAANQ